MNKYYQQNNQLSFKTVKHKWLQHELRDLLFINCTFDSTAILSEKHVENDETKLKEIDDRYYEFAFNNIKKTLEIMGVRQNNKIIVYSQLEDYKVFLNEIDKISEDIFKGSCTYENCLRLIKNTTCGAEEDQQELSCSVFPTLKDGGYQDLYHFPELKLYLYIYDQRGGIIVSEDYDQEKMKIIFEKCLRCNELSEEDNKKDKDSLITLFKKGGCLLNYYWMDKSVEIIYNKH